MDSTKGTGLRDEIGQIYVSSVVTATLALGALIMSQFRDGVGAVGVVMVIFFAAFTAGAMLGFVFGVPRILAREGARAAIPDALGDRDRDDRTLRSNTNLERISDWLATMLVGVGLSQLHNINTGLVAFRDYVAATARVFDGAAGAHAGVLPAVAPPFLIAGACVGFMVMYLYTRTALTRALHGVEQDLASSNSKPAEPGA